jgi:hypothetical protein
MKKYLLLVVSAFVFNVSAQTPIQEFNFNGNRSNTLNSNSFLGVAKFVNDRTGLANSAIRVVNSPLEVTMPDLPLANTSRTISIWIKYNDITAANYIWGYGSSINSEYFGLLQQSTTTSKSDLNLACWGPANDAIVNTSIAVNTWYNYTVTYDGLTSKIYRNGELIKSTISPRKLTSGIVFAIGKMGSSISINADIDDLKIYDLALSSEQVAALYNSSSILVPNDVTVVSSSVVVPVVASVPVKKGATKPGKKPTAKQQVVLSNPIETVVAKSSEIYSTQGVKVISSSKNDIDVSTLPEGTYLLKVTNSSENSKEQKLTIK